VVRWQLTELLAAGDAQPVFLRSSVGYSRGVCVRGRIETTSYAGGQGARRWCRRQRSTQRVGSAPIDGMIVIRHRCPTGTVTKCSEQATVPHSWKAKTQAPLHA